VQRNGLLTNCEGEFPGPTIEARSGDTLIVQVENALESPDDGVSIHWHGLFMKGHNNMDGAVGFTQCAIPPGRNFTYEFRVGDDQHGTFWYHAHSQVQRGDGLYGGLVIHRPDGGEGGEAVRYGYQKEVLLLVGDWYHRSAGDMLAWYTSVGAFGNEVYTLFPRLERPKLSLCKIFYRSKFVFPKANQLARTRLSGNQWPWFIQLFNGSTSEANRVYEN
jgi:FtsP/CotA-like multicopper oxidase with cupredoxin domain